MHRQAISKYLSRNCTNKSCLHTYIYTYMHRQAISKYLSQNCTNIACQELALLPYITSLNISASASLHLQSHIHTDHKHTVHTHASSEHEEHTVKHVDSDYLPGSQGGTLSTLRVPKQILTMLHMVVNSSSTQTRNTTIPQQVSAMKHVLTRVFSVNTHPHTSEATQEHSISIAKILGIVISLACVAVILYVARQHVHVSIGLKRPAKVCRKRSHV